VEALHELGVHENTTNVVIWEPDKFQRITLKFLCTYETKYFLCESLENLNFSHIKQMNVSHEKETLLQKKSFSSERKLR